MLQFQRNHAFLVAAMVGIGGASAARAGVIASDNASSYTSGATDTAADEMNGLNNGTGFGPWVVTDVENPPASGATTSSPTGNGGSFVNSATNDAVRNPAPVFDVYDNGNPSSANPPTGTPPGSPLNSSIETATRSFNVPMTVGGSFSFTDTLHNMRGVDSSGNPTSQGGFQLLDSTGRVLFDMHISGGAAGWSVTDANENNVLLAASDTGHPGRNLDYNFNSSDTLTVTINDATGDYTLTSTGHRGDTFTGGQIDMTTGGPAAFAIYNNNGGLGSDIQVNNLSETAVPEPASILFGGLSVFGLLLRRRR